MKIWKNWPYWVRGGVVGLVLSTLTFFGMFLNFSNFQSGFSDLIMGFLYIPTEFVVNNFSSCEELGCFFVALVTMPLVDITIGIIAGFLYGKIKNHKKLLTTNY